MPEPPTPRNWLLLTCREYSGVASASLDRPPSRRERAGMAVHEALCAACRRYVAHLRWLTRALGGHDGPLADLPGPELPPEARERIRAAIDRGLRGEP